MMSQLRRSLLTEALTKKTRTTTSPTLENNRSGVVRNRGSSRCVLVCEPIPPRAVPYQPNVVKREKMISAQFIDCILVRQVFADCLLIIITGKINIVGLAWYHCYFESTAFRVHSCTHIIIIFVSPNPFPFEMELS